MSIEYYTKLVSGTPMLPEESRSEARLSPAGRDRLLMEALRMMLATYWQLHNAGRLPAHLSDDDADECISIVASSLPDMVANWQPRLGAFSTYFYRRIGWAVL